MISDCKGRGSSSMEDVQKEEGDFHNQFEFYPYAARHVFDHVSLLESECSTSSFPLLHGYMKDLFYLHRISPLENEVMGSFKFCNLLSLHKTFGPQSVPST